MLVTSPVAPQVNGLVETVRDQIQNLYETDEQGSQIATALDNEPKILGHIIHLLSV
mgnify:CR=1 FL=1